MATGIYEWKDKKVPDFGSMVAPKDPATPAAMQTPAKPDTMSFGDMVKAGPAASSPTPSFNDLFSGMGETRAQNLQGAQQAVSQGLNPSTPSAGSQLARNAFIKAGNEAERKVLEQSALGGRADTGQISGDRREFLTKTLLPQRMDFEAQLQAQEEQQAQARQQAAVGNVLAMEGLGEQGRATDAGNALATRGQDIAVRGQDIQDRQAGAALAESKAGRLQQGEQFAQTLAHQTTEGALDRTLSKYIADRGFNIDEKKLGETIRQFDSKLAFDEWATKGGWDEQEKTRLWDAHLQDLSQKWQTGERLGAQEHQVLLEDKRAKVQQAAQEFDKLTQLEILGKTQEWDKAKMDLTNTYQTLRDQQQMGHEQAMTVLKGDIEAKLTQMGINADAAKQAAQIEAAKWTQERELAHESAIATAELAFKYEGLRENLKMDKERLNQNAQQIANQALQFGMTFGLDEKRTMAMLKSEESKAKLGELSTLMELAGDNPDMMALASKQFVQYVRGAGMISDAQAEAMIENIDNPPPAAPGHVYDTLVRGVGNIGEGNILTGTGQVIGGGLKLGGEVVKDTAKGVAAVGKWIGNLF